MAKKNAGNILPAEPYVIEAFELDGKWHADVVAPTGDVVKTCEGCDDDDEESVLLIAYDWVRFSNAKAAREYREKMFV